MITCSPWKPVAIKNVEPKVASAMQKGASAYSNPWNVVKILPNRMVRTKENFAFLKFSFNISWWDHVMVTPDDKSKMVFRRGILMGLKEIIEVGGQDWPSSTVGEMLLWKKAQKNEAKNRTSEAINKTMPVFNPFITKSEWLPWFVPSRCTSRHHEKAIVNIKASESRVTFIEILFIKTNPERTKHNAPFDASNGQGLTSTRWKGLYLFVII